MKVENIFRKRGSDLCASWNSLASFFANAILFGSWLISLRRVPIVKLEDFVSGQLFTVIDVVGLFAVSSTNVQRQHMFLHAVIEESGNFVPVPIYPGDEDKVCIGDEVCVQFGELSWVSGGYTTVDGRYRWVVSFKK